MIINIYTCKSFCFWNLGFIDNKIMHSFAHAIIFQLKNVIIKINIGMVFCHQKVGWNHLQHYMVGTDRLLKC